MFHTFCTENLTIHSQGGAAAKATKGRVSTNVIIIPDARIPLVAGDAVERTLPSGVIERFIITDPGFIDRTHGIQAHYQAKYRRTDAPVSRASQHTIHVSGANARVNVGSIDRSSNVVQTLAASEDGNFAAELQQLRKELLTRASHEPEQYVVIGKVAEAETAAKAGDDVKAHRLLGSLGQAAAWVLTAAKDLGLKVAVEYISAQFK